MVQLKEVLSDTNVVAREPLKVGELVPARVLNNKFLSDEAKWVFTYLCHTVGGSGGFVGGKYVMHWGSSQGFAQVSVKQISVETGIGIRKIRKILDVLENTNLIKRVRRGERSTSRYYPIRY